MVSFFMRSVTFAWYCGRLNSPPAFFPNNTARQHKACVPLKLLQFSCTKTNRRRFGIIKISLACLSTLASSLF